MARIKTRVAKFSFMSPATRSLHPMQFSKGSYHHLGGIGTMMTLSCFNSTRGQLFTLFLFPKTSTSSNPCTCLISWSKTAMNLKSAICNHGILTSPNRVCSIYNLLVWLYFPKDSVSLISQKYVFKQCVLVSPLERSRVGTRIKNCYQEGKESNLETHTVCVLHFCQSVRANCSNLLVCRGHLVWVTVCSLSDLEGCWIPDLHPPQSFKELGQWNPGEGFHFFFLLPSVQQFHFQLVFGSIYQGFIQGEVKGIMHGVKELFCVQLVYPSTVRFCFQE